MAEATEKEVNNTEEHSEEENTEETEGTEPDSSQENEGETESEESEEGESDETESTETTESEKTVDELAEVPGETPRERALRIEVTRLKREKRTEQGQEILQSNETTKKGESKVDKKVLEKYKPEELASLREVLPALAEELGFVRKDELSADSYAEKAQSEIDSFIEAHPEYSPEKDKDGLLWERLRSEYTQLYKAPANPKDFRKIFERIHKDIMGIQVTGSLPKVKAAQEKVKVASHAGPSAANQTQRNGVQRSTTNLRTDALKGFSEDDIADIQSRANQ